MKKITIKNFESKKEKTILLDETLQVEGNFANYPATIKEKNVVEIELHENHSYNYYIGICEGRMMVFRNKKKR